jgi:RNA polymerase sigma-70 factor (ECF subfamily)
VSKLNPTTEELIANFIGGRDREESFRLLFERFYDRVYRFLRRKGATAEDSADLTQEVFFSVYRELGGLRDVSLFEHWIFKITVNTYRSHIERGMAQKRSGKTISLEEEEVYAKELNKSASHNAGNASKYTDAMELTLENERMEKFREAMRQLPEQMRRCAQMRIIDDLSYQEIASRMGISVNTVKAHLHKAQKILKEKLRAYTDEA